MIEFLSFDTKPFAILFCIDDDLIFLDFTYFQILYSDVVSFVLFLAHMS